MVEQLPKIAKTETFQIMNCLTKYPIFSSRVDSVKVSALA